MTFIGLLLLQILVMDNMQLSYYIHPYVYPLIILALPFRISTSTLMVIAFFLGLIVDISSNSMGLHAASLTLLAFLRPVVVEIITPRSSVDASPKPNIRTFGLQWYLFYAGILILLHHLLYFFLETFSFHELLHTLGKVLLSSVFSLFFVVILAYLFSGAKSRL